MKTTDESLSISQARSKLLELPETLAKQSGPHSVAITKHGKPVMALMDWDLYESIIETLEILGDKDLMLSLRESLRQLKAGKTIPWKQARLKLGM